MKTASSAAASRIEGHPRSRGMSRSITPSSRIAPLLIMSSDRKPAIVVSVVMITGPPTAASVSRTASRFDAPAPRLSMTWLVM